MYASGSQEGSQPGAFQGPGPGSARCRELQTGPGEVCLENARRAWGGPVELMAPPTPAEWAMAVFPGGWGMPLEGPHWGPEGGQGPLRGLLLGGEPLPGEGAAPASSSHPGLLLPAGTAASLHVASSGDWAQRSRGLRVWRAIITGPEGKRRFRARPSRSSRWEKQLGSSTPQQGPGSVALLRGHPHPPYPRGDAAWPRPCCPSRKACLLHTEGSGSAPGLGGRPSLGVGAPPAGWPRAQHRGPQARSGHSALLRPPQPGQGQLVPV